MSWEMHIEMDFRGRGHDDTDFKLVNLKKEAAKEQLMVPSDKVK